MMFGAPEDYMNHPWRLGLNEKLEGSDNVEGVQGGRESRARLCWTIENSLSNVRSCLAPFFDARALIAMYA